MCNIFVEPHIDCFEYTLKVRLTFKQSLHDKRPVHYIQNKISINTEYMLL